jgi:hypothetical protein
MKITAPQFWLLFGLLMFFCFGNTKVVAVEEIILPEILEEASLSATLMPTVAVKENITEPQSQETIYRLESVLEKQELGGWNGFNSIKKVVKLAVSSGVSANTVVLLLMLPLIATLVAVLHYIFGFSGYGIFMPTTLAVTFLATGIFGGLILFGTILMISIFSSMVLRKFKLHFWPARSINLMLISLGTFGLMLGSSMIEVVDISRISIFPVLFMIMLAEEFVRTQLVKSRKEAKRLTMGTLVLAILGAGLMNVRSLQEMVLLHPEWTILIVLIVNLVVGNYKGVRLSELKRFKGGIRTKEEKQLKISNPKRN